MFSNMAPFSLRASLYSFILTVTVIWIHAVDPGFAAGSADQTGDVFTAVERLLGSGLGQLAVPGFFCLSGYLFFRNMPEDIRAAYDVRRLLQFFKNKLRKRVSSLLIPYLVWNGIYYLIYIAAGRASFGLTEAVRSVLFYRYNPVFWYLFELVLITIITPLIYMFIRDRHLALSVLCVVFAAACCYDRLPFHYVNEDALFYYMTGSFLALHFKNCEDNREKIKRMGALCFFIFIICEECIANGNYHIAIAATVGGRVTGLLALFAIVNVALPVNVVLPRFTGYNFLVYALHYLEIRAVRAIADGILYAASGMSLSESSVLIACLYILMPFICIIITVPVGEMMKRLSLKLYMLMTGGRN